MTQLTPAYRIKLISTKQGSAQGGGEDQEAGGGTQAEGRPQQGVSRDVQQEEGTIKTGRPVAAAGPHVLPDVEEGVALDVEEETGTAKEKERLDGT